MRKIQLGYVSEESEKEIADMEKLLEGESIHEQTEEQEEYNETNIVSFTFEDGMVPRRDGKVGTAEAFDKVFVNNDKIMTTRNVHGFNVFLATSRDDLHRLGYIIMNTAEFIQENPDGLYDIWVSLLDEVK